MVLGNRRGIPDDICKLAVAHGKFGMGLLKHHLP